MTGTLKVLMLPNPDMAGESGIKRVVEAYHRYLPDFGITLVKEGEPYDLKAVHAGMTAGDNDICHCHGLHWSADYQAPEWEYRTNARVIDAIRNAKQITVPSAWVAETFQRDMRLTPHVIPHGVEWEEWQHNEPNEGYIIGYAKNRVGDVCDPSFLPGLARQFPSLKFFSTFAPKNRTSNISTPDGIIPHRDMKIIIQRAGVYIAATKETWGIQTVEAMAAGVPILGAAHGGNVDLVQHGVSGYLYRPGDIDDMAEGLAYCLQYRDTLGANGRELARAWTWERACEMVAGVYRMAMEEHGRPMFAESSNLPLATVIIPCYNGANTIQRTIKSVQDQTLNNLECIIVDDGSTDNSRDVVLDCIKADRRFRYIYQENGGVANARNAGFNESKGLYICCLDKDDIIAPSFLATCIEALEADRSLYIAYTGLWYIKPDGSEGLSEWPGQWNYDAQLKQKNQIPTCNVARREVWERLGGQRQRYAPSGAGEEDAEMWLRVGAYGMKAKKVTDEGLFIYSWMSGQVSGNPEHKKIDYTVMHPWMTDGHHPFASVATPARHSHPVRQYDEPVISVIIPVGPGHERMVINALDSLEMQHFRKWEVIVVADFEDKASPYGWIDRLKMAYPYIRDDNTGGERGPGYARNRAAKMARAPFLFFLDADDVLNQADALDKMLAAWKDEEAIIYSDYVDKSTWPLEEAQKEFKERLLGYIEQTGQAIIRRQAAEYDYNRAVEQPKLDPGNPKMPYYLWCTVSVLIPTAWHRAVGGFDETMDTWEDVDYLWRLARAGYCFKRVPEPLLLYNFDTGQRREKSIPRNSDGRHKHQTMVKYIRDKYEGLKPMACNCRGKRAVTTPEAVITGKVVNVYGSNFSDDDFVMIEFRPNWVGNRQLVGAVTKIKYGYARRAGNKFLVHRADVEAQPHIFHPVTEKITALPVEVKKVEAPKPLTPVERVEQMQAAKAKQPFDIQTLPGISKRAALELAQKAKTRDDVLALGVEGLKEIKGIGPEKAGAIIEYLSR